MKTKNTIQDACKDVGRATSTLKNDFENLNTEDIDLLDIAIKDLINVRSVIDFSNNKQLTHNNWNRLKEEIQ